MKTIILLAIVIIALTSCNEIERITVNETKNKVESTEEDDKSVEESSIEKEAEKTTEEKDIESSDKEIGENLQSAVLLNPDGQTIEERYNPPEGFKRVQVEPGSYQEFLRKQKLKPYGSKVLYHDGREKKKDYVYDSVLDVETGPRDLHQCADAIMLLRAEYLYANERYDDIKFHFVSGFLTEYSKWIEGYRIDPDTGYYPAGIPGDTSYESFREYMDMVFAYAGTLSMLNEAKPISPDNMKIGDIFLDKGHTVIIMDIAENAEGKKMFMVAQSYMPAQQTQILKNQNNPEISPWYSLDSVVKDKVILTPEWKFNLSDLMEYNGAVED